MRKWSGGVLILLLAVILILRYSNFMMVKPPPPPQKQQTAYDFFHTQPSNDSTSKEDSNGDNKPVQSKAKRQQSVDIRPHLIDVEGLSYLYYFLSNVTKEESKALLVWAQNQMRLLLSRSDALPETAQGIKEAAIAWKELLSLVVDSKSSDFGKKEKDCPYYVSALSFNTSVLGGGTSVLDIPCGLVEDSSITVIGIPDGQQGSFQIELTGSQLPEEPKPPIVLHYNVILPGDNLKKEPVIFQNSWTTELGWGKEERCPPDHSSTNFSKVDGLVKCNARVLRSTVEDISNASHPNGDKLANVSTGAHVSANFPFVEGSQFTATLWAGVEGFHMTVNGRHETSFAYREKLEPWLVSGINLEGGLGLVSVLAKGLPVSENLDLAVDVEHLKAPPISKKRLVMLIGVFSTGNNFERRMALRRSWMQYQAVRSGSVAVRFFIGLVSEALQTGGHLLLYNQGSLYILLFTVSAQKRNAVIFLT
ncbi:unnamed protein product [Ilex paraguariensis]|uniref:Galectin n=1 Tax=Ilex paraguariensis TaxID=185542 RepID=A0ABC8R1H4_9AQUA